MCYFALKVPSSVGIMIQLNQRLNLLVCAVLIGITTLMLYSGAVYAHKVNMFAYSDGPNVFIEGYFSDGNKAQNSTVTVYAPDGKQLLQGTTDDKGQFSFPIPEKTDLRIVLNAGMGHRTEYVIKASELSADSIKSTSQNEDVSNASVENMSQSTSGSSSTSVDTFSNDELSKIVERAVGQAIKPLMREVSEMKEERGFTSIIGGIGFIFGILGIGFYLKARKGIVQQAKHAE
jgi:nickel transport protein